MRFFGNPLGSVMDAGISGSWPRSMSEAALNQAFGKPDAFRNPAGALVPGRGQVPRHRRMESVMGILFDMVAFYRWLEQASERELLARRDEALNMEARLSDEDLKRELRRLVRMIEEELVARKFRV